MRPFTSLRAVAAPFDLANCDTDKVIPARFLRKPRSGGYGGFLFHDIRAEPGFVLNRPAYRAAQILVAERNFGCGSSREGAVWALHEMGVRCVIGSSFGDIFFNNCFQNGLLPVVLDRQTVESLAREVEASQGAGRITVDLAEMTVTAPSGKRHSFAVEPARREALLEGLDEIAMTLKRAPEIAAFQARDREQRPWIHAI